MAISIVETNARLWQGDFATANRQGQHGIYWATYTTNDNSTAATSTLAAMTGTPTFNTTKAPGQSYSHYVIEFLMMTAYCNGAAANSGSGWFIYHEPTSGGVAVPIAGPGFMGSMVLTKKDFTHLGILPRSGGDGDVGLYYVPTAGAAGTVFDRCTVILGVTLR